MSQHPPPPAESDPPGDDPAAEGPGLKVDPRFILANERTFLAWIRTSISLLAAAAAVGALDLGIRPAFQTFIAVVLALTGLVCSLQAWRGRRRAQRALERDQPLPQSPGAVVLVIGVAVVAACLLVALLV